MTQLSAHIKHLIFLIILMMVIGGTIGTSGSLAQEEEGEATEQERGIHISDPLLINVYEGSRAVAILVVQYNLVPIDEDDSADIRAMLPRIFEQLYYDITKLSRLRFRANRVVDAELLDTFMQRAVDKVIGPKKAQIFIKGILMRNND